ncbi:beta/alpha-amylase-like [Glandiceps talaboti]
MTDRFAAPGSASWNSCGNLRGYCNGNFRGVIEQLDYIQGMGFNAIWISPLPQHVEGDYHGYSATDLYTISWHWGDEKDLNDLIAEAHMRDIWIMVDVVANHMGIGDVTTYIPFDEYDHYHEYCEIHDWGNTWEVENCWLFGLPDLAQENPYVDNELCNWIDWLLTTYDIDGIRIDTVSHVPKWFWENFMAAANIYDVGEVYTSDLDKIQYYIPPMDAALNYPFYWTMKDVLIYDSSMRNLANKYNEMKFRFGADMHLMGTFADNHDQARFLCDRDSWTLLENYIMLTLTMEGIPIVYYGTEQAYSGCADPENRESLYPNYNTEHPLYWFIATTNYYRSVLGSSFLNADQVERWIDDDFFVFTRSDMMVCSTKIGEWNNLSRRITYHNYPIGTVLVNIYNTDDKVTVESYGIDITIIGGKAKIYLPESYITANGATAPKKPIAE